MMETPPIMFHVSHTVLI